MADAKSTSPAKPLGKITVGALSAAIWPDQRFTIERVYRTKNGQLGNAKSLRRADAADLDELVRLVREWFVENEPEADERK